MCAFVIVSVAPGLHRSLLRAGYSRAHSSSVSDLSSTQTNTAGASLFDQMHTRTHTAAASLRLPSALPR